jgi:hypothetical protein
MKNKLLSIILFMQCILLVSCASSSYTASSDTSLNYRVDDNYGVYAEEEIEYAAETVAASDMSYSDSENAGNDLSERKIITTASLSYQTQVYDEFVSSLTQCITEYNGYIESTEMYGNGLYSTYSSRSAYITARVPADSYDAFMTSACSLGTLTYRTESRDDITMTYVDVESHIAALESERDALMSLMEKAESLSDVIDLQTRLTEVNYELDSYNSQLRKYDNLISYCTVNINVSEVVREVIPEEAMTFGERISNGLEESFIDIADGAKEFAVWFITSLPYIAIWAVVIIIIIVIIRCTVKRKRSGKLSKKKVDELVRKAKENNDAENVDKKDN